MATLLQFYGQQNFQRAVLLCHVAEIKKRHVCIVPVYRLLKLHKRYHCIRPKYKHATMQYMLLHVPNEGNIVYGLRHVRTYTATERMIAHDRW